MTTPGLRERKKQKTRWAIQEHALRLFAEQGYDATTVEQIAAAAEISPSTFFRYFRTKEDVVIEDEYDPLLIAAIEGAPPELAPIPAMRHGIRQAFAQIPAQEYGQLADRMRLILAVPALRARTLDNFFGTIDVIAVPIARRVGTAPTDLRVRSLAGAFVGALLPATAEWANSGGKQDLGDLIDQVLANMESGYSFAAAVPEEENPVLTSRADVVTDTPDRYAKQLVSHLGHRITFRTEGASSEFDLGEGRGVIVVGEGVLTLLAEAADPQVLAQIQDVLGRHLERFGSRQELVVDWQPVG